MDIIEKMRLDGKKILVTGGARGIGKSVALAFAQAGAAVAIADMDGEAARLTAEELALQTGKEIISVQADVTQPEQAERMVRETVEQFGRLDVAFCNAGICINEAAEEMRFEQWKKVIDVNLTGVFLSAQAAGRVMLAQGGGSIINTASMSAHIVNVPQKQCAYNASKAGVIQLTKSLAVEWADRNVRVNSISPGSIGTDLTLNSPQLQPLIQKWNEMSPVHRLGRPDELQAICVYLAGDASSFTTGADFVIDGGFTCFLRAYALSFHSYRGCRAVLPIYRKRQCRREPLALSFSDFLCMIGSFFAYQFFAGGDDDRYAENHQQHGHDQLKAFHHEYACPG